MAGKNSEIILKKGECGEPWPEWVNRRRAVYGDDMATPLSMEEYMRARVCVNNMEGMNPVLVVDLIESAWPLIQGKIGSMKKFSDCFYNLFPEKGKTS